MSLLNRVTICMSLFSPLLNPDIQFVAEDEAAAMKRYTKFAADFYVRLYLKRPDLHGRFRFFRDPSTSDVWSVCETPDCSFGVQLDPDIEAICVWDSEWHDEIGTWFSDAVAYVIETLDQRYFQCA